MGAATPGPLALLWSGEAAQGWGIGLLAAHPSEVIYDRLPPPPRGPASPDLLPGWVGYVAYEHGRDLEPKASRPPHPPTDRPWPRMMWMRVERHAEGGEPLPGQVYSLSNWSGQEQGEHYRQIVRRAVEYIHAGDIYQVNLAHRLRARFSGSARALACRWFERARPWFGAYLELPDDPVAGRRILASASPELFLRVDPITRTIRTRPMKGTRPGAASAGELEHSPKDQAELNMIVDLMRNDLTRVCELPSVRVIDSRRIESHGRGAPGGVWQATAAIEGRLRSGVTPHDILAAAFPPGSVTGAPKIRAMQIIDELESASRGPYCGCIGVIGDGGAMAFSVAIRTAQISGLPGSAPGTVAGGTLDYHVGAGIVADSDPESEWLETLDKAAGILGL